MAFPGSHVQSFPGVSRAWISQSLTCLDFPGFHTHSFPGVSSAWIFQGLICSDFLGSHMHGFPEVSHARLSWDLIYSAFPGSHMLGFPGVSYAQLSWVSHRWISFTIVSDATQPSAQFHRMITYFPVCIPFSELSQSAAVNFPDRHT